MVTIMAPVIQGAAHTNDMMEAACKLVYKVQSQNKARQQVAEGNGLIDTRQRPNMLACTCSGQLLPYCWQVQAQWVVLVSLERLYQVDLPRRPWAG